MSAGPKSVELFRRACELMPAGVNSPVRAFRSVGGEPLFYDRAAGCRFTDADGRRYTDYVNSWGPLILGHAHPSVVEAVKTAAGKGMSFGAPCAGEVELAELVIDTVPFLEMVRFVLTTEVSSDMYIYVYSTLHYIIVCCTTLYYV